SKIQFCNGGHRRDIAFQPKYKKNHFQQQQQQDNWIEVFTNNEDYVFVEFKDSSIISGAGNGGDIDCGKFSTTLLSSFVE
ncbi:hypothetical protein DERP_013972, partial [Dermatophagoides pteronyssinus]